MAENVNLTYQEHVSSKRTGFIFASLTILFLILSIWRVSEDRMDILSAIFFFLFVFFLFYLMNYRTLVISLTPNILKLRFGIFKWEVPLENVEDCRLDELASIKKYGGAGIHFMLDRKRYRASFNFLEYPRVVVALKRKAGPVQDISFSTRRPEDIIRAIQQAISTSETD